MSAHLNLVQSPHIGEEKHFILYCQKCTFLAREEYTQKSFDQKVNYFRQHVNDDTGQRCLNKGTYNEGTIEIGNATVYSMWSK